MFEPLKTVRNVLDAHSSPYFHPKDIIGVFFERRKLAPAILFRPPLEKCDESGKSC
jgi:hypothetical protein